MSKTLARMADEIRTVNTALGWRTGANTWGELTALLHTELSEAVEAYRDHRLADATEPFYQFGPTGMSRPPKPEGVGSEFADVLIRLVDMCDIHAVTLFDMDCELADVDPYLPDEDDASPENFGDWIAWLHWRAAELGCSQHPALAALMLRALVAAAEHFGIDLGFEYGRKITHNRTRPYQHGGRTISDAGAVR